MLESAIPSGFDGCVCVRIVYQFSPFGVFFPDEQAKG